MLVMYVFRHLCMYIGITVLHNNVFCVWVHRSKMCAQTWVSACAQTQLHFSTCVFLSDMPVWLWCTHTHTHTKKKRNTHTWRCIRRMNVCTSHPEGVGFVELWVAPSIPHGFGAPLLSFGIVCVHHPYEAVRILAYTHIHIWPYLLSLRHSRVLNSHYAIM